MLASVCHGSNLPFSLCWKSILERKSLKGRKYSVAFRVEVTYSTVRLKSYLSSAMMS